MWSPNLQRLYSHGFGFGSEFGKNAFINTDKTCIQLQVTTEFIRKTVQSILANSYLRFYKKKNTVDTYDTDENNTCFLMLYTAH